MEPPNHEMSPMRVLLKIQKSDPPKLDQPSKWSREFNEFIARALVKDPSQRPTADDLLKVSIFFDSPKITNYFSLIYVILISNLQHSFVNKELDSKPIRDLLLEYKADVVEEEVVDEDTDVSFRHDVVFLFTVLFIEPSVILAGKR